MGKKKVSFNSADGRGRATRAESLNSRSTRQAPFVVSSEIAARLVSSARWGGGDIRSSSTRLSDGGSDSLGCSALDGVSFVEAR